MPPGIAGATQKSLATLARVGGVVEVSAEDTAGLVEAIRRAAGGEVVHVLRDGRRVADIVSR